jgi:hypothetical protein
MPLGPQPRRARGTVEHPNSALGLRLVLATFGLIVCSVGWVLLLRAGHPVPAYVLLAAAVAALIDLLVITTRMSRRKR